MAVSPIEERAIELVAAFIKAEADSYQYSIPHEQHEYLVEVRRRPIAKPADRASEKRAEYISMQASGEPCPTCGGSGRV